MTPIDPLVKALGELPVSTVYESADKQGDVAPHIRQMVPGLRLAGRAFTLKTMPGDNLGVFHAIAAAPAGSVLVIDGGDSPRVTIWGGTSTIAAQARGLSGCVTNAAVRDLDQMLELRFPVYAPGTAVRGTAKNHPGWLGVPVTIGEAIVHPGDIVLGDADGLVIVAQEHAQAVYEKARERFALEQAREQRLRAGEDILSVLGLTR